VMVGPHERCKRREMKIKVAIVALIPVAAVFAFRSSARAGQTVPSRQAPATSSTEPAQSVWDGVYTEEQANRGEPLYAQRCARCHAPDLTGGEIAPALNSAEFKSNWSGLSVDDLLERIKVSMPQDNPGSLSRQQTADILAFVLSKGGFPEGKTELAREAEVLKAIRFEANKPETAGVTAIDAKSGEIAGTIEDLGGRTEHLASDEAGHVFLNMQDVGKLHKLDAQGLKVVETWQLAPPCGQPSSMDMDRAHNRVFIGCRSGLLAVVNGGTGKIVATQPIGTVVDALEFDPMTGLIYVSTGGGDGALSIFHQESPDQYTLVDNVETLPGARTLALDHKSGRVYLPVAGFGPRPEPTPANPQPRAPFVPGTFSVLVVGQ
jgi:mono/diheme cytochrome c family protein